MPTAALLSAGRSEFEICNTLTAPSAWPASVQHGVVTTVPLKEMQPHRYQGQSSNEERTLTSRRLGLDINLIRELLVKVLHCDQRPDAMVQHTQAAFRAAPYYIQLRH